MSDEFYITGGTIPPDAPSYVERAADRELLAALQRGELCYVLNARQMGKSSLSVRTRQALEAAGTRTAFLDLQKFGSSASAEQWYRALLERIGSDLKVRAPFLTYWRENAELPPLSRLFGALRDVALEQIPGRIVVFLDEIDVVRDLGFKTDEFFGAIRESYNARAADAALSRLTCCIIGTVAPTDLIRDVRLSPFNIGTRIRLADFTNSEAAPLARPLPGGAKMLDRVLWWTSGHPYLTQRLCAELTVASNSSVDAMVARLYLAKSDADVDENVKNVRNTVLRAGGEGAGFDRTDLLTRYGRIVAGKRVPDDDTDGICSALRLTGLVTSIGGTLHVRNRVYAKLFDASWVRANLPDAELRRQQAAVARARWQIVGLAGLILFGMGGLTVIAVGNSRLAKMNAARADSNADKAQQESQRADQKALEAQHNLAKAVLETNRASLDARAANESKASAVMLARQAQDALVAKNSALKRAGLNANEAKREAQAAHLAEGQATAQARRADRQANIADRSAYAANMNVIQAAWDSPDVQAGVVRDQLEQTRAYKDRGFEWGYWNRKCHLDLMTISGHSGEIHSAAYSPDGSRIVTGSVDSTARVWDANSGKLILILRGHSGAVHSATFSPDGNQIVTGSDDKTAKIWDAHTGMEVLTLKGHLGPIYSAIFSPDGKRIATGSGDNRILGGSGDSTAKIWDAITGAELTTLRGHLGPVYQVAFSPDGKRLVTGSNDFTAKVWYVATGKEQFTLAGHGAAVEPVAFSPDGKLIVTGSHDHTSKVWDANSGKEILTFTGHSEKIVSVAFSPDSKRIATGSGDNTARVWDAYTGKEVLTLRGHSSWVYAVAFSPDGTRIVTGSADHSAKVWETSATETLVIKGRMDAIHAVDLSRDGRRVVTASQDGEARVWDSFTGASVATFRGHRNSLYAAAFSPDGRQAVTGCYDGSCKVWETDTGKEMLTLDGHSACITSAAYAPDGRRIVTASNDNTARVWDAPTGKNTLTIHANSIWLYTAAFSPEGSRIVTGGGDGIAKVWDAFTGRAIAVLKGHLGPIASATFSPDGTRILTGSEDKTAKVWNSTTGLEILTLKGHSLPIQSARYSPDGKRIVTGSQDSTAKIWDASTGKELLTLKGHLGWVNAAKFSTDGRRIVTVSEDGMVRVWTSDPTIIRTANDGTDSTKAKAIGALASSPVAQAVSLAYRLIVRYPDSSTEIADGLNAAAWNIVDPAKAKPVAAIARAALKAADFAVVCSGAKDGAILDTLAAARFACGDLLGALSAEQKAAELLPRDKDIAASLRRYEHLTPARSAKPK